jgi:hypothetical protein
MGNEPSKAKGAVQSATSGSDSKQDAALAASGAAGGSGAAGANGAGTRNGSGSHGGAGGAGGGGGETYDEASDENSVAIGARLSRTKMADNREVPVTVRTPSVSARLCVRLSVSALTRWA